MAIKVENGAERPQGGELSGWWPGSGRGRYGGMEEGSAIFITWAGLGDELAVEVEERQTGRARQRGHYCKELRQHPGPIGCHP